MNGEIGINWLTLATALFGSSVIVTLLNRIFAKQDKRQNKQDTIIKSITDLSNKLDKHIYAEEEYKATRCRTRILKFADELRRGIKHSEESFNDILGDIDDYLVYCQTHEDTFLNSKADAAIRYIEEIHDRIIRGELTFL